MAQAVQTNEKRRRRARRHQRARIARRRRFVLFALVLTTPVALGAMWWWSSGAEVPETRVAGIVTVAPQDTSGSRRFVDGDPARRLCDLGSAGATQPLTGVRSRFVTALAPASAAMTPGSDAAWWVVEADGGPSLLHLVSNTGGVVGSWRLAGAPPARHALLAVTRSPSDDRDVLYVASVDPARPVAELALLRYEVPATGGPAPTAAPSVVRLRLDGPPVTPVAIAIDARTTTVAVVAREATASATPVLYRAPLPSVAGGVGVLEPIAPLLMPAGSGVPTGLTISPDGTLLAVSTSSSVALAARTQAMGIGDAATARWCVAPSVASEVVAASVAADGRSLGVLGGTGLTSVKLPVDG